MLEISRRLKKGSLSFAALFTGVSSREQVVTFFLAVLELLRLGRVSVAQDSPYGDILINASRRRKTS
jgi:segregation and condensation protein A